MLVRMLTNITGNRDGLEWPAVGETLDVPDHEAADLIQNGYAKEATSDEIEADLERYLASQNGGADRDGSRDASGERDADASEERDGDATGTDRDGDTDADPAGDSEAVKAESTKPRGRRR